MSVWEQGMAEGDTGHEGRSQGLIQPKCASRAPRMSCQQGPGIQRLPMTTERKMKKSPQQWLPCKGHPLPKPASEEHQIPEPNPQKPTLSMITE